MILHQAFYGHQITGYCLLSSSKPQYNEVIKKICSSIGTPNRVTALNPFFINYIYINTERFMVKCSIELSKSEGRRVLFFHILFGNHQELLDNDIGIGTLIYNNLFQANVPKTVTDLKIESGGKKLETIETNIKWNNEPLAIVADNPNLNLIAGILKDKIDNKSWASFTFRPSNDYDIYILSSYSMIPSDRKCVNSENQSINIPNNNVQIKLSKNPDRKTLSRLNIFIFFMLLISMFVNLYLILNIQAKNITEKDKLRIQNEYILEINKKFKENSPSDVFIYRPWSEEMHNSRSLHRQYEILNNHLLINAGYYIDFMNKEILLNK